MKRNELIMEIRIMISSMERILKILEEEEATKVPDKASPIEKAELPAKIEVDEKDVTELLKKLGMPAHIKGYYYIRTAIMMCVANPELLDAITKKLYPEVAKAHATTWSRAERAIRHAIEVSFDRINPDIYAEVFQYTVSADKGKPTNSEYISAIVDYIIMNYK